MEMPIAQLTWWTAEINRDPDKRRQPFDLEDFLLFRAHDDVNSGPPEVAGAAMRELIRRKLFPRFAMAFYPVLEKVGMDAPVPQRLAFIAADAILMAPRPLPGDRWGGFLIAEHQAAGQVREFRSVDGDRDPVWLEIGEPSEPGGAVWVEEAACLPIQPFPDMPDSLQSQPVSLS